jgi:hypothetical protein
VAKQKESYRTVFSLRQEIILFLHENNKVYHELENDEWCSLLALLCDMTEKLSELNRGRKHCLDFSLITAQFRAIIGVRNARHCWITALTQGHLCFSAKRIIKKNRRRCDTRVSIFKFTYFDNVHLSLTLIAEIVLLYLTRPPPRCQFIAKETNVSHRILIDYFNFIREVLIFWTHNNSEQIGGEGKIVEIDEAKIGKRKYNGGRYLEGQWVLGGIERASNKFFLAAVEDRTANTLVGIIKDKIKPGMTIYSDCCTKL